MIDPGDDSEILIRTISQCRFTPRLVFLTHAHIDHISAVGELSAEYNCPVWLHPGDLELYNSPANQLPPWLPPAENLPDPISEPPESIAGMEFSILHTPGHSPGSCCLHFAKEGQLFSGDTLFQGSVGRTDLPGGSQETLTRSIQHLFSVVPISTRVHCGHGPSTTVEAEKMHNPFVNSQTY